MPILIEMKAKRITLTKENKSMLAVLGKANL